MQLARLLPCRAVAVLAFLLGSALAAPGAGAQQSATAPAAPLEPPVEVSSSVSYQLVGRLDTDALNRILAVDTPKFFGVEVAYTPATNAVRLYRVTYASLIPEQDNRPTLASGLLAVPEVQETRLPLVSYQHGTVYGKQQVPSFADQSPETLLMIAQFAGQGYLLIGADYFGLGTSGEPEGYMVKASHQQATQDMLTAARSGCRTRRTALALLLTCVLLKMRNDETPTLSPCTATAFAFAAGLPAAAAGFAGATAAFFGGGARSLGGSTFLPVCEKQRACCRSSASNSAILGPSCMRVQFPRVHPAGSVTCG